MTPEYCMTPEKFAALASQGYNRIPITRTVLADTETPLTSYLKLANGPYSYLLESVQGGEKWGRYSIIGLPAREVLTVRGDQLTICRDGKQVEQHSSDDPLEYIKQYQEKFRAPEDAALPQYFGGLAGYFSYDCVRYIERRLRGKAAQDDLATPDILLMLSEETLVFDNLRGKIHLVVNANPELPQAYQVACARLDELHQQLRSAALPQLDELVGAATAAGKTRCEAQFESSYGEAAYKRDVERVKDYIVAGDTMQVVLSQRLSKAFSGEPINLYRALRCLNPSPYMYFLNLEDHSVVGSSPEILARLEGRKMTVRPIAGTRRRGYTEEEDVALEQELVNDPKEIAEHLMLIDLGRNDVGRVAKVGSVKLTEKMLVERFSHVMHITSNVCGELKEGLGAIDVMKASLPAGTLSGAPKIRAMEIIDELEPVKRGIYGGAVGHLSWSGNMDTAIAIRTAVIKNGRVYVQAGAGVVADSQPDLEWKETMNKARAIFSAVDWVEKTQ